MERNAGVNNELPRAMTRDDKVAIYVEALRDAYYRLRKRIDPRFMGLSVSYNERLEPIAEALIDHNGDPYSYLLFVFDRLLEYGDAVYPNMFISQKMLNRFFEWRPVRIEQLRRIVHTQEVLVKAALRDGLGLPEILLDMNFQMGAPFRYALAYSNGLPEIAERFREETERMLIFEPYYKELLGNWLPERMKNV